VPWGYPDSYSTLKITLIVAYKGPQGGGNYQKIIQQMKNAFYVQLMLGNLFNCGTEKLKGFAGTRTPHRHAAVKIIEALPAHTQKIVIIRTNWNNAKGIFNVGLGKETFRANSLNEPDGIFNSCI